MNIQGEKTAIICIGGGMRSAHGAGFLYALAKDLHITHPDMLLGSSGDAGNIVYFAAGQYESSRHVWCDLLSTPKFISLWRLWRIMDIDYLVDTVFKKQDPLDTASLKKTKINWAVPITNFDTGATRYATAKDNLDPFEILRAAKALPVFFGKRVPIWGGRYFDGEIGPTVEDHVNYVLENGAKRILIINHAPQHTWVSKLVMEAYTTSTTTPLRHAILRDVSEKAVCLTLPQATVVCVVPKNLPAGTATRDQKKLRATFAQGVKDAVAIKEELSALFLGHGLDPAQKSPAEL